MNKLLVATFTLFCFSSLIFAQEKLQFGLSTEGSWLRPTDPTPSSQDLIKDGFGAGMGVYASRDIFWRVSADVGLLYRYSEIQQYYSVINDAGGYYVMGDNSFCITNGGNGVNIGYLDYSQSSEGWDKLPMHSLVVPIHLSPSRPELLAEKIPKKRKRT
jgi:hypothetical protein